MLWLLLQITTGNIKFQRRKKIMQVKFNTVLLALLFLLFSSSTSMATPVDFSINAGGYGYETSWAITQDAGSWAAGMITGSMANNTPYSFSWDLDPGGYLLAMEDSFGDGLDGVGGSVSLIVDSVTILDQTGRVFGFSYRLPFDVPETGPPPVPEPATIFLLGSGLFGLAWCGRKRKKV